MISEPLREFKELEVWAGGGGDVGVDISLVLLG